MKKYIFCLALITSSLLCLGQNSSIDFIIKNLGVNVDGHFNAFTITTTFDAKNTLKKVSGEIQVKSIKTGIYSRDEHLLEEDYFHIAKYPKIYLESTEVKKQSSNSYTVKATLKIKGKSKHLTIPIKVEDSDTQRIITSNFEINRRDFGVGGSSFVMSKTVKLKVVHVEKKQ